MTQTIERPRVQGPGSGLGGHWRVIVRNDDHNTFEHVALTLARYIPGVNVDKGFAYADQIHNSGQAIVWTGQQETGRAVLGTAPGRGADDGPARAGLAPL